MRNTSNAISISTAVLLAMLACRAACGAKPVTLLVPLYNPPTCDQPAVNKAVPLYASPSKQEVKRAGKPACRFPWALPTETRNYVGYYVGGGGGKCCCGGECPRRPLDGTWGRDYQGGLPRIVQLGWTHPQRYQGGDGKYDPDGPRFPHFTPEMLLAPP